MNKAVISRATEKRYKAIIVALSIVIPFAVALLFRVKVDGIDLTFLPGVYATINGITAVLLVAAVLAIKQGNKVLHQRLMTTCIMLSALFLILYVAYHMTSESTTYGGDGSWRMFYYIILVSHIVLSVVVVPLVLFTYLRSLLGQFERHRKLARLTFPIWLYVAVSGVVVYLMISPYYGV